MPEDEYPIWHINEYQVAEDKIMDVIEVSKYLKKLSKLLTINDFVYLKRKERANMSNCSGSSMGTTVSASANAI